MKHTTFTRGCPPSGLSIASQPVPPVGTNDVLIQVAFVGTGGTDISCRKGTFNPREGSAAHHMIIGLEVSGLVAAVGKEVTEFKLGDRVCALLYGGGYAEYAVAPQQQVLELPDELSLEEGACVPENYWTVWTNLFEPTFGNLLENPSEKTLLVHGGTGGIGSTALALAKSYGARTITTVSSAEKAKAAAAFGADVVIDYNKEDFVAKTKEATDGRGADVVLCFLGGDYMRRNVEALAPYGTLVQLGLRRGREVTFDFKELMHKWATITGGHLRPRTLTQKGATRDLLRQHVLPKWKSGAIRKPTVCAVYPLEEAALVHERIEKSTVVGKIVLRV